MGQKNDNDTTMSLYSKRIGGMKKYVTSGKTEIPVDGELLKPVKVLAVFQACLDKRAAVAAAHAAYKAALVERIEADRRFRATDDAVKGWVLQRFGDGSAEATEFGYAARRAPTLSAADRAKAVLLNKATREARGTVGKRKKLEIKGTLTPTAPAVPASASTAPAGGTLVVVAAPATAPAVTAPAMTPIVSTGSAPVAAPVVTPAVNAPAAGGSA